MKIIVWLGVGGVVITTPGTVLKGCNFRKVKNHWPKELSVPKIQLQIKVYENITQEGARRPGPIPGGSRI